MADRSISFSPFITVFDPPEATYYSSDDDGSSHQDDDVWDESGSSLNYDTLLVSTAITGTIATVNTATRGHPEEDLSSEMVRGAATNDSWDVSSVQCLGEDPEKGQSSPYTMGNDEPVIDMTSAMDFSSFGGRSVQSLNQERDEGTLGLNDRKGKEEKGIMNSNAAGESQSVGSANSSAKSLEEDMEEGRLYLDSVREEIYALESRMSKNRQHLGRVDDSTIRMGNESKDFLQANSTPYKAVRSDAASGSEDIDKTVYASNRAMVAIAGATKEKSIKCTLVFQLGLALGLGLVAAGCAVHFLRQSEWGT